MRRELISPAVRILPPSGPFAYIDASCTSADKNFADKAGNTFSCSETLEHWTDGISAGSIRIDQSPVNSSAFAMSLYLQCSGSAVRYPVVFGNRSGNGAWLEVQANSFRFRSNAGTIFSGTYDGQFTFGISKSGSAFRFYLNGLFVQEKSQEILTENEMTVDIAKNDRINNLLIYKRALPDHEMKDLSSLTFKSSRGFDHLGYLNSKQSFPAEIQNG